MQITKGAWHTCEQCVPGSLSSSPAQEPGNEATWMNAVLCGECNFWRILSLATIIPSTHSLTCVIHVQKIRSLSNIKQLHVPVQSSTTGFNLNYFILWFYGFSLIPRPHQRREGLGTTLEHLRNST